MSMIFSIWHLPQQQIPQQALSMACRHAKLSDRPNCCQRATIGNHAHCAWCIAEMTQTELVAMLRSRARKSGTQTSHYRGVSLLKQTGKWHAQINVGGKQVLYPSTLPNSADCATCPS